MLQRLVEVLKSSSKCLRHVLILRESRSELSLRVLRVRPPNEQKA